MGVRPALKGIKSKTMLKKYAVAILSQHDNENEIYFVMAESKARAVKLGLIASCGDEDVKASQIEWNESLSDDYDDLIGDLYNSDLCCCAQEIPNA